MTTTTNVSQVKLNIMTQAQYDALTTPSATELYAIIDADTLVVDTSLSTTSTNPVQNKVVTAAINAKQDSSTAVTHAASSAVGSGTNPVYIASNGEATALSYTIETSVPSGAVFTDTKNTAGATDTSSQIYLIGATTQGDNPQTYSNDAVYVDTTGHVNTTTPDASDSSTKAATTAWVDGKGYITGITSSDVTTALGYTPYSAANPDGYISSASLSGLTDTTITSPSDGQIIVYDSTTSKWINANAPASATWGNITGTLSNQTDLQNALDGKQATITGAATTITSSDLTASRALVSDTNGKVAVSSITSTKLGYLSDVTSNIQSQLNSKISSLDLDGLTDVTISKPKEGDFLQYTNDKDGWVNHTLDGTDVTTALGYTPYSSANPSGYISSASLSGLTDTTISSATGGQFLEYNSTSSKWENKSLASTDITTALGYTPYSAANPDGYISSASLSTLTDVTLTNPTQGQNLTYDAINQVWINSSSSATVGWGGITGTLSDQTDLQNALDGKQATLVSGTNIKTVNNKSVLGSGNLDIFESSGWTVPASVSSSHGEWDVIVYGAGKHFTIGTGSSNTFVNYSTDGVTWSADTDIFSEQITFSSATYGNGKFVAVTGDNSFSYSSDGFTWITPTTVANLGDLVVYGNGRFVAVGSVSGYVATSQTGTAWTTPAVVSTISSKEWVALGFGAGKFVLISNDGYVSTSGDGNTWTTPAQDSSLAQETSNLASGIAYGNNKFLLLTTDGKTSTSEDGITWSSVTQEENLENYFWEGVTYGNGRFVSLSDYGDSSHYSIIDGLATVASTGNYNDLAVKAIPNPAFGTSSSTAATVTKVVSIPEVTELNIGQIVVVQPSATSTVASSNLKLNNFPAYPMRYNNAAITTSTDSVVWNAGFVSQFIFDGTYWQFLGHGLDSNTTYTLNYLIVPSLTKAGTGSYAVSRYSLLLQKPDMTWEKPTDTSVNYSIGTTKTVNTRGFLLGSIKYYSTTTVVANGADIASNTLYTQSTSVDMRYSTNCGATPAWTAGSYIYFVGTIGVDGLFYLDSTTWWTDTLPTTNDGKVYVRLGRFVEDAKITLDLEHPVFYHDGTRIRDYVSGGNKQDTLVSGTNIKTINNESLLGSGNITISGGGGTPGVIDGGNA